MSNFLRFIFFILICFGVTNKSILFAKQFDFSSFKIDIPDSWQSDLGLVLQVWDDKTGIQITISVPDDVDAMWNQFKDPAQLKTTIWKAEKQQSLGLVKSIYAYGVMVFGDKQLQNKMGIYHKKGTKGLLITVQYLFPENQEKERLIKKILDSVK